MRSGLEEIIGARIRAARRAARLTQLELARRVGIARQHVSRLELGERGLTLRSLLRIARALAVAPSVLIDGLET